MDITSYFDVDVILGMIKRRLWIAIILFSTILVASIGLSLSLPDIYTTSASILVEGQSIPKEYVRSTVTMGVERRLQVITQEILSRKNLERLITQFGLYEDLKDQGEPASVLLAAMRRDIGIQIKARRRGESMVAFGVSYTSPDPHKAVDVANSLASFYIDKNIKVREQQSLGTSEFLQYEMGEVQKRLESQEGQVAQYKIQHVGELPEQLNANLGTLTMLQTQLQTASDSIARAHERKRQSLLLGQFAELSVTTPEGTTRPVPLLEHLEGMRQTLAQMRMRLTENHPDVLRLKKEIGGLEEQLKSQTHSMQPGAATSPPTEQAAIDAEVQRLNVELNRIQSDIVKYQQRIENTPLREQELLLLTRDYGSTRELYTTLLGRLDEAKLADSLEQNQKAERFRLLETAAYPDGPTGPRRTLIMLLGLACGLAAAIASVLLREFIDSSFHRTEDLRAFTIVPVLGTVPHMMTEREQSRGQRRQFLGAVALAVVLFFLVRVSYQLGEGSEQLARSFSKSTDGIQVR